MNWPSTSGSAGENEKKDSISIRTASFTPLFYSKLILADKNKKISLTGTEQFDQDFMADPNVPFSWRMSKKDAGTGTLGDMASHTLSYALSLVGDVAEVIGQMETFIKKRNISIGGSGHTT